MEGVHILRLDILAALKGDVRSGIIGASCWGDRGDKWSMGAYLFELAQVGRFLEASGELLIVLEEVLECAGFDLLLEQVRLVEEENEGCVLKPLRASQFLEELEGLLHAVGLVVLLKNHVVLVQSNEEDDSLRLMRKEAGMGEGSGERTVTSPKQWSHFRRSDR